MISGIRSTLSGDEYHAYSDVTMESLLDSLESLVDEAGSSEYEIEYSVSSVSRSS